jgi:membrane-associated protein
MNKKKIPYVFLCCCIGVLLTSCSKQKTIIGKWHNKSGYSLTLNADSTAVVGYDASGKTNYAFSKGSFCVVNAQMPHQILRINNLEGQGKTGSFKALIKFVNGKTFVFQEIQDEAVTTFDCKKQSTFTSDTFTLTSLLQPQFYIEHGGLFMLLAIIFAETGLFAGFFFPGDSLLFVAGIYWQDISESFLNLPFFIIMALVALAAIVGNLVGYWIGKKIGPTMYTWKDRWYFKQRHLQSAKEFYDQKGAGAIVLARFIPIVRTFAPIIAGIVQMDKKKYSFYSIVGAIAWVFSMMLLGRYLQAFLLNRYCYDLTHHIEYIVLGIVFATTAPVLWKLIFSSRKKTAS